MKKSFEDTLLLVLHALGGAYYTAAFLLLLAGLRPFLAPIQVALRARHGCRSNYIPRFFRASQDETEVDETVNRTHAWNSP